MGACQVPEFLGDVEAALGCIEAFAGRGDAVGAQLLLFPECFLQGYLADEEHVRRHALDLRSSTFTSMLRRLRPIRQTLVFGVIEQRGRRYCNTAVVVAGGELLGAYRKTQLLPGEALFHPGEDYPTFQLAGVTFGINICSDTRSADAAAQVAARGARLLLVPAQNMMRRDAAVRWKDLHHSIRAERPVRRGCGWCPRMSPVHATSIASASAPPALSIPPVKWWRRCR